MTEEQEILDELISVLDEEQPEAINNGRYELVLDMGKPYSDYHEDLISLKTALVSAYHDYMEMESEIPHLDIMVLDHSLTEPDITECPFIQKMIKEIMETEQIEDYKASEVLSSEVTLPILTEDPGQEEPEPEAITEPEEPINQSFSFKGKIDPKVIQAFFYGVSSTVQECKVKINRSGFRVQSVDPAHVNMIDMELHKAAFLEYRCVGEANIGVDVDKVLEVIKAAKKGDIVNIKIDVTMITISSGIVVREIAPLDTSKMSDPKVPNLNLPGQFTIKQDYLKTALDECSSVSDHITIQGDKNGIKILAENDTDNSKSEIPNHLLESAKILQAFQSKFPLDYLMAITKPRMFGALLKGKDLNISMGSDYPIKIEYEDERGRLTYLLAPRIEQE